MPYTLPRDVYNLLEESLESIKQQINIIIAIIGLAFANLAFVEVLQKLLGIK